MRPLSSLDHFRHPRAEAGLHEATEFGDIGRKQIEVVDAAWVATLTVIAGGDVLQGGPVLFRRLVAHRVVVDLEHVTERILETESPSVALVAVDPANDLDAALLDRPHPAPQRPETTRGRQCARRPSCGGG